MVSSQHKVKILTRIRSPKFLQSTQLRKENKISPCPFLSQSDSLGFDYFSPMDGFSNGKSGKESAWSAGDLGSILGSGRSPGEGNGNPLWYSCWKNSMDRGAWRATVHEVSTSQTPLSSHPPRDRYCLLICLILCLKEFGLDFCLPATCMFLLLAIFGSDSGFWERLPRWLSGKESICQCRRPQRQRLVPQSEGGHGNSLQDSYLKNPIDRGVWWAIVHGVVTWLSNWEYTHALDLGKVVTFAPLGGSSSFSPWI